MKDISIVGGGIAGLICSIQLAKRGFTVQLFEKKDYPKHKVCGEYISNEVLPILLNLGIDPLASGAKSIDHFEITSVKNNSLRTKLPLGGFSISRFTFDQLLYQKALSEDVAIHVNTHIDNMEYEDGHDKLTTLEGKAFNSKISVGAYGKYSKLDKTFSRPFTKKISHYTGIKYHLRGEIENDTVFIHNFKGGYCGVSKVENNLINVCYLIQSKHVKNYKSLKELEAEHLGKNKQLKRIFSSLENQNRKPIVISNIHFGQKSLTENGRLMIGDSAGMISPICGNGMAMAIQSGVFAANAITDFLKGDISHKNMLSKYKQDWHNTFGNRLHWGQLIQHAFINYGLANNIISLLQFAPWVLPKIIKKTHGKSFSYLPNTT